MKSKNSTGRKVKIKKNVAYVRVPNHQLIFRHQCNLQAIIKGGITLFKLN